MEARRLRLSTYYLFLTIAAGTGPTLGGIRARHWNIVIRLCCYRLFERLPTKSPEQTKKKKDIVNELLNCSVSDKQRETCESDQRLPRFLRGCQWQHAYLSEKGQVTPCTRVCFHVFVKQPGIFTTYVCLLCSCAGRCRFSSRGGRDKSLTFTKRQNSGGERRRTEETSLWPNFNLYCEWCWMKEK